MHFFVVVVAFLYSSGFLQGKERTCRGKLEVHYFKMWKVHAITQHLYQSNSSLINLPLYTFYLLTYFYLLFLLLHSQILCLSDTFKQIYRGNATLGHSFWWGIFHFYPGNLTWAVTIPPHSLITLALSMQNNYPVFMLSWSIQLEWAVVVVVPPVCSSPPAERGWPRGNNLKEFITRICLADE